MGASAHLASLAATGRARDPRTPAFRSPASQLLPRGRFGNHGGSHEDSGDPRRTPPATLVQLATSFGTTTLRRHHRGKAAAHGRPKGRVVGMGRFELPASCSQSRRAEPSCATSRMERSCYSPISMSQCDCGARRFWRRRPVPPANVQSGRGECSAKLIDVQLVAAITRVEVGDHGHHVDQGGEEDRGVPGRWSGERVRELVGGGGGRHLRWRQPDHRLTTVDAAGARRCSITTRLQHPHGRSRPPLPLDDRLGHGCDLCKGSHRFEVGPVECCRLGCVHARSAVVRHQPGPSDRRSPSRARPRSARAAASLPALQARTSAPAELLAVRTRPKRCCTNPSTCLPRSSRAIERPTSSTATMVGDSCSADRRVPRRTTWPHGRRNRRGTTVETAGSPPPSIDARLPSATPPARGARCT